MDLSIIIPCYNVEHYVSTCINSFLENNLDNVSYEIIIINDGSTDSTFNEILKFKDLDSVRIYNQENKGLSATRNIGLNYAKGKYVYFCDSDDWVDLEQLLFLLKFTKENSLNIGIGNYINVVENIYSTDKTKTFDICFICTGPEIIAKYYISKVSSVVWRCIFERDFLLKFDLRFLEDIYFEDMEFMPRVFSHAHLVGCTSYQIYYYRKRIGSITNSYYTKKKISDSITVAESLLSFSENRRENNTVFAEIIFSLILRCLVNSTGENSNENKTRIILILSSLCHIKYRYGIFTFLYKISSKFTTLLIKLIIILNK